MIKNQDIKSVSKQCQFSKGAICLTDVIIFVRHLLFCLKLELQEPDLKSISD